MALLASKAASWRRRPTSHPRVRRPLYLPGGQLCRTRKLLLSYSSGAVATRKLLGFRVASVTPDSGFQDANYFA